MKSSLLSQTVRWKAGVCTQSDIVHFERLPDGRRDGNERIAEQGGHVSMPQAVISASSPLKDVSPHF